MASHLAVAVLAVLAACCTATSLREKRQAFNQQPRQQPNFNCQSNGPFQDPEDCSKFFECYNGLATRMDCPTGQEFNPQNNRCDYPAITGGQGCRRVAPASEVNLPCLEGGNIDAASFVGHKEFCNAYFTCGNGLLHPQCTFCGEGLYFDRTVNLCVSSMGLDVNGLCNGLPMVAPVDQEFTRLLPTCHPGANYAFQALVDKIRNGNFQG